MGCPICGNSRLSDDVSVVEKAGTKVILQGTIYAVISPNEAHYPPFSDYCTVSLYPLSSRKGAGAVKYLKFPTRTEMDKWGFIPETKIRCEGCLHMADGKEIVFDVAKVEFL